MTNLQCKHCGGSIEVGNKTCPHCGIPLPPNLGTFSQKKFILFFITLIVFCAVMILWLPPDWTRFMEK